MRDTDLNEIHVPCKPDKEDPKHKICTPEPYVSSFMWDGADNIVFRPIAQFFKVDPGGEALNTNAMVVEVEELNDMPITVGGKQIYLRDIGHAEDASVIHEEIHRAEALDRRAG